jgi:hypothetical protein
MVRTCHCAAHFDEPHQAIHPAHRSVRPILASVRPLVTALGMMCDALREGLAAYREYEELRSRGMPHDTALKAALGLGASPKQGTRAAARPLYFAGKA